MARVGFVFRFTVHDVFHLRVLSTTRGVEATSKRDLVFVRRSWSRWFRRCAGLGATGLPIFACGLGSTSSTGPTTQQLHALAYHAQLRSLLPGLLVIPSVHLQTAFDENRPSFLQVFTGDLRETRP